jgi:hypothetical protein
MSDYTIDHWTTGQTVPNGENASAISVSVNNRAATRQAIINNVRQSGINFVERSNWAAHKNRSQGMRDDWGYTKIAIHHAGRSFICGPAALQLQDIQDMQMSRSVDALDDIGYHYALDCFGNVFEGRDIRFKGENVQHYNTGVIGIVLLENLSTSDEGYDSVTAVRKFMHRMGFDPTPSVPEMQRQSIAKLINILCDLFYINTLGGHREFPGQLGEGKICPGNVGLTLVGELRKTTGLSAP